MDAVDTVCSGYSTQCGCSGIVVYGGGDIVFGAKRSNQWMQWTQYAVDTVHSGRHSLQWAQYTVDTVHTFICHYSYDTISHIDIIGIVR